MSATRELIDGMLASRLDAPARTWLDETRREVAAGLSDAHFAARISLASRHVARGALAPSSEEMAEAARRLPGWNPERWTLLDAARVALVLARTDLARDSGLAAIEGAFRYADMGELVALYRSLAHLPGPERFAWRAGEGCRANMVSVFEAVACDTPYAVRYLDDIAWRQLVIKCIFVGAPLWRVYGLDDRLDAELARMALDLADERRSAGRDVQPELWLCLGTHAGDRGRTAIEQELAGSHTLGRCGAALALARAGALERLRELAEVEPDLAVRAAMRAALDGRTDASAGAALNPAAPLA